MRDVYFGVDYHSHLGTRRGGMAAYDPEIGLQRKIHSIESSPFRTKFARIFDEMQGIAAIGCISNTVPSPLLMRSKLGTYAICIIGRINNAEELIDRYLSETDGHFDAMTGGRVNVTELVAALINQKEDFTEGIKCAQEAIEGTASILILKDDGTLIAARDRFGRLPVLIGKRDDGFAVTFESFAYQKLGFEDYQELIPGEIVHLTPEEVTVLYKPECPKKRICAFLWAYFGYPTSNYEGVNVEVMRYRNGALLAKRDGDRGLTEGIDYVGGVPDSGTPHAIGYANESRIPFARAFIKYTPTWSRSFIPSDQQDRDRIAKMKQIPVNEIIKGNDLLFIDDSIVRGTQLRETVEFLYGNGAKDVHVRSACPPIMYSCKYLDFTRITSDNELIARRMILELEGEAGLEHIDEYSDGTTERGEQLRKAICEKFKFASLGFQSLQGVVEAIGLDQCELCTYCWNGKE